MSNSNRILVKLLPTIGLAAAESRANLRPLYEPQPQTSGFGISTAPAWYLADLPDGAETSWDLAHSQVAGQLGIDESAVLFAEPDLEHAIYPDNNEMVADGSLGIGENCGPEGQTADGGRVLGPDVFAWHLGDDFSQLGAARAAVEFTDRRTRIAHIDTGYDKRHASKPEHIRTELEHNFVDSDGNPNDAQDPDNKVFALDNSGHGTGTLSVLAGGKVAEFGNAYMGAAPEADIVPLRIADRVALFRTSALAQALRYATQQSCDVVTLSMGGLASSAWNDAVNEAYEAGMCICAAAGNNVRGLVTQHVVYPARYHRVLAVCGVMANGQPYTYLTGATLNGNFGPPSSMTAALATYTPNIPWAKFGCETAIRLSGEGTSAATPQMAAAVAIWYEKYKSVLPRDWRRVEAVRKALFDSAKNKDTDPTHFGHGILQAAAALAITPVMGLPKTPGDSNSFAFLRVITGLGITEIPPREIMFNLELTQLWLVNEQMQATTPDPEAQERISDEDLRKFMGAVIEDKRASLALRKHVAGRYSLVFGSPMSGVPEEVVTPPRAACNPKVGIPSPPFRRIRTYAVDPSLSTRLETASINDVALKIRWEKLEKGPVGEYLSVVDTDVAGITYDPVDLDDERLLAQDGCPPAEGNPAFHQQMVYAIAMKTIEHFERALGRRVLWRPRINPEDKFDDSQFVRQLTVRPHALRQANAYYSPQDMALMFGYFEASASDPGDHVPGSTVYACLSHDIVAHETTHAILDGMHRRFNEATNPDVLALHEAFADIVALMHHFTIAEILENEINRTRGNLETESILGSLAVQFGRATGGRGALRDAIGTYDKTTGKWTRLQPNPADYKTVMTPHARGSILVAAVFDAFIAIYQTRTADLLRIYTGGTGVLPSGAIHPDLVRRLAAEAAKSAGHVLNMCIRALDYIPPVDITFGEYLRGIITADGDLVEEDRYNYRIAFVEAFRRRGIYPRNLDTLSVD
ncbi:MAG: S8 family serine peptidase, partial [Acidobacteriota bacterium]|nr:S8 family serine peptidase [Acidobacteriota bacterium]